MEMVLEFKMENIGEMLRKINPRFNRKKYKELSMGRSVNGANERKESTGDSSSSENERLHFITSSMRVTSIMILQNTPQQLYRNL